MQSKEEIIWRIGIYFDVFQVLVALGYMMINFAVSRLSEKNAVELAQQVAAVPWTDQQIETTVKIGTFFEAMDLLDETLRFWQTLNYLGFAMNALLLRRIVYATAIHPRLGSWNECMCVCLCMCMCASVCMSV